MSKTKQYMDGRQTGSLTESVPLESEGIDSGSKVNKLRYQRLLASMTQRAVADASGINIRQLQKYESGEYAIENMTLKSALAISKALKCDIDDLL